METTNDATPSTTDRIEKSLVLKASKARVHRALTTAAEFGAWFGMKLEGELEVGKPIRGRLTIKDYEHVTLTFWVERLDESYVAYRWHPYAVDAAYDYSVEPTTLVEFRLEEEGPKRTRLTVVESGFDKLPEARRAVAFRSNEGGWRAQLENIRQYVEG